MAYNNFYFLDISETGGDLFKNYMAQQVFTEFSSREIEHVYEGHNGWTPVKENTFTVALFQDPAKRSVSHFASIIDYLITNGFPENHDEIPHPLLMQIADIHSPTKNEFFTWFENCKDVVADFQSKSLFEKVECHSLPIWQNEVLGVINEEPRSKEDVLSKINDVNLLIKKEDITAQNIQIITQEIFNAFEINSTVSNVIEINETLSNKEDIFSTLYNSLSTNEIQMIYEMNTIDTEIFYTENIFWN